jgi:hypothetical protein
MHVYYKACITIIQYRHTFAPVTFCKVFTKQENGICFPAEKYLQYQFKVEKRTYIAKKRKMKKKTAKPLWI